MAIDDAYGFMQGFMGGQAHVSDMKTAEAGRQAMYAENAARRFKLEEDTAMRPYTRQGTAAAEMQKVLDFRYNKRIAPYKEKQFLAEVDTMLQLKPQFLERAGVQHRRDMTQITNDRFNIAIAGARTVEDQNRVLDEFGKMFKVQSDDKGNMWTTDLSGNATSPPMPADLFNLGMIDPRAASVFGAEYQGSVGLLEASRKSANVYAAPDMGMGAPAPAAQGDKPPLVNKNNPVGAPAPAAQQYKQWSGSDPSLVAGMEALGITEPPANATPNKRYKVTDTNGDVITVTEFDDGTVMRENRTKDNTTFFKMRTPAAAPAKAGYAATMPYHSSAPVTGFVPQVVGAFAKYYAGGQ